MKHAGQEALDKLERLLAQIRKVDTLSEKKPGIFYLRGSAFLHFHEDPSGLFADLRVEGEWRRLPVTTIAQQKRLVSEVNSATSTNRPRKKN